MDQLPAGPPAHPTDLDIDPGEHAVMGLLRHGVPLSLLIDLSALPTPGAAEIFTEEGRPEQRWWEQRRTG